MQCQRILVVDFSGRIPVKSAKFWAANAAQGLMAETICTLTAS